MHDKIFKCLIKNIVLHVIKIALFLTEEISNKIASSHVDEEF